MNADERNALVRKLRDASGASYHACRIALAWCRYDNAMDYLRRSGTGTAPDLALERIEDIERRLERVEAHLGLDKAPGR